jgi:hypothetical protein
VVGAATVLESAGSPVFVLGGGGRTGSTLVQRLLISTGEIMIWGEHAGVLLDGLHRIVSGMQAWIGQEGAGHLEWFRQQGWNAWIANINPSHEAFVAGARAALLEALATPAAHMGYRRWGFKEIRYNGAAVSLLKMLFPDAPIIVLVRHPADALRSIKVTTWYEKDHGARPETFLAAWAAISASLAAAASKFDGVLVLHYEDLVGEPERFVTAVAKHVSIEANRFDRAAIATRVRGAPGAPMPEPAALDARDRAALAASSVREAAAALGYRLD